jgi:DNA-binding transcriptional LysR family regulator
MALQRNLDLDLLRTLCVVAEEGSFTRAAERVGRTQSAVSLQIQRLEGQTGQTLLLRGKGERVELTAQGRLLVERALGLLRLNDDILSTIGEPPAQVSVRLGTEDHAKSYMPKVLAKFAGTNPGVAVDMIHAPPCLLVPQLRDGKLDLILCEAGLEPRGWPVVELWRAPLRWITSTEHAPHASDPLPLSLAPGNCPWRPPWLLDCVWRGAALRALERAGRRYHVVSTSTTVFGQQAAVHTGLAVTVSTIADLPAGLRPVTPEEGLPEIGETVVLLLKARAPRQPVTEILAEYIIESFASTMEEACRVSFSR